MTNNATIGTLIEHSTDTAEGKVVQALHDLIAHHGPIPVNKPRPGLGRLVSDLCKLQGEELGYLIREWGNREMFLDRPTMLLHEGNAAVPTIWLLGWRPGDSTPIHDHDDSEAGVCVLRGVVGENVYHHHQDKFLSTVTREFLEGSVVTLGSPYIHRMYGLDDGPELAVTVHGYYPALNSMEFYDIQGGLLVKSGSWSDAPKAKAA